MQIMISRCARGLREAKNLYHARVLVPATSAGGHQLGKKRRVIDVQFVRSNSHDVTVFSVHVADSEEVLAPADEVMVKFNPESCCCEARAREFRKRVQSEAVGVEEDDIEHEGGSNCGQWPGDEKIEGSHGFAGSVTAGPRGLRIRPWYVDEQDRQRKERKSQCKIQLCLVLSDTM